MLLHLKQKLGTAISLIRQQSTKVAINTNLNGYESLRVDADFIEKPEDAAAIVVLQEWWGFNTEIRNQAQNLADRGYVTLIPDLYRGKVALNVAEAQRLLAGLDWGIAVKDIHAAIDYLRSTNPNRKVGLVGFGLGGALAFLAASAACTPEQRIDCAISFFGLPPSHICNDLVQSGVPIQGHFELLEEHLEYSNGRAARSFEKKLKEAGSEHEPFHYHDPQQDGSVRISPWYEEAIVDKSVTLEPAWSPALAFLDQHLIQVPPSRM